MATVAMAVALSPVRHSIETPIMFASSEIPNEILLQILGALISEISEGRVTGLPFFERLIYQIVSLMSLLLKRPPSTSTYQIGQQSTFISTTRYLFAIDREEDEDDSTVAHALVSHIGTLRPANLGLASSNVSLTSNYVSRVISPSTSSNQALRRHYA
ncbi:hypothetical protein C8J56DRAFT_1039588 [Mycena floridula]|nr:hypothetical protein C8J56DRAFT_1039588 [Mycena floridula]